MNEKIYRAQSYQIFISYESRTSRAKIVRGARYEQRRYGNPDSYAVKLHLPPEQAAFTYNYNDSSMITNPCSAMTTALLAILSHIWEPFLVA